MNHVWIELLRDNYRVYVLTSDSAFIRVRYMTYPFFTCKLVEHPQDEMWKIATDRDDLNINKCRVIIPSFDNCLEPPRKYFFLEQQKLIYIDEPNNYEMKLQIAVRLCRDIIKHLYLQQNIYLHGGMVTYKGKGICFLGDKKAGKTSLVLAMLAGSDSNYVGNDDISIGEDHDKNIVGYGWPRAISIRKDSIVIMKDILRQYDFNIKSIHPYNSLEASSSSLFLYPKELSEIYKRSIITQNKIDLIIFPHFDDNCSFEYNELTSEEKIEYLKRNINLETDKYFMDFTDYFDRGYELVSCFSKIDNIPMFSITQNIRHMDYACNWIRSFLGE